MVLLTDGAKRLRRGVDHGRPGSTLRRCRCSSESRKVYCMRPLCSRGEGVKKARKGETGRARASTR